MSKTVDAWRKIIQGLVPNVTLSAQIVGGNLVIESFQSLQGLKNLLQSASPETIQQALSWELRAEGQEGVSVDDIELLTKAHGPVVDDVLDAISNKPNEAVFEEALYQAFIKKIDGGLKLIYTEDAQGRLCIKIDVSAFPVKHRHSMSHIYLDSFREWFSGLGSGEILQCLGSTLGGNNSEAVLQASSETDSKSGKSTRMHCCAMMRHLGRLLLICLFSKSSCFLRVCIRSSFRVMALCKQNTSSPSIYSIYLILSHAPKTGLSFPVKARQKKKAFLSYLLSHLRSVRRAFKSCCIWMEALVCVAQRLAKRQSKPMTNL